ncbi:MAG: hypothetical protein WC809_20875 [Sinimarinibacterium sp.]|jgi:hypothetical protein
MRTFTFSTPLRRLWIWFVLAVSITACSGSGGEKERVLDTADESVQRAFANFYFFSGYGPTLDFVIFPNQSAAVRLRIDNVSPFTVSASVNLFERRAEIDKWINNQYSDALEPDAPSPIEVYDISGSVTVTSTAFVRTEDDPTRDDDASFDVYAIEYSIADAGDPGVYTLAGYAGTTEVYVASGTPGPSTQPTPTPTPTPDSQIVCGDNWYNLTISGLLEGDTITVRWNPGWSGPYTGDSQFGNVNLAGVQHSFCGPISEFPPLVFELLDTTGYECQLDGDARSPTITVECMPAAGRE